MKIELPAEIIQQLVSFGLQTQGGQLIVQTVLQMQPALREAVVAAGGNFRVACQEGWIMPGEPGAQSDPAPSKQNGTVEDGTPAAVRH